MSTILVDTSALVAIVNARDNLHTKAENIHKELIYSGCQFITSSAIITELINYYSSALLIPLAINLINVIEEAHNWEVVFVDAELYKAGFELRVKMTDKDWSMTDCITMVLAKHRKITRIFTNDHHFEQAGFEILLK